MGMFKDMRDLSKSGKEMKKERVPVKVDPNDHSQLMIGLAG